MTTDAEPGRRQSAELIKEALATYPSGVTIVTTSDDDNRWWGFTATSFSAVSMEPPLVLVCLAHSARCHPVFARATRWLVHMIDPGDASLAERFASRRPDKFADAGFTVDSHGQPALERACVGLACRLHARYPGGDHLILVGEVEDVRLGAGDPAVYYKRRFRQLADEVCLPR